MRRPGGYVHHSYKLPGKDTARAVANVRSFLAGARSIEHVTADELARRYQLSARQAEYELTIARNRREAARA